MASNSSNLTRPSAMAHLSGRVVTDTVWENQRGTALIGRPRFSSRSLLPTDRAPWSDAAGGFSLPRDSIQLSDPDAWDWVSEWMIDMALDVDADGWMYSFNFGSFPWSPTCSFTTYVRRRRWIRRRRARSVPSSASVASTAAPDFPKRPTSMMSAAAAAMHAPSGLAGALPPTATVHVSTAHLGVAAAAAHAARPHAHVTLSDLLRRHVRRGTGSRTKHPPRIDRERLESLALALGLAMHHHQHGGSGGPEDGGVIATITATVSVVPPLLPQNVSGGGDGDGASATTEDTAGMAIEGLTLDDVLGARIDAPDTRREALRAGVGLLDYEVSRVHVVTMLMQAFPADRPWLATEGAALMQFFSHKNRLLQTLRMVSSQSSSQQQGSRESVGDGIYVPPAEILV
ncbi:hypothetical protein BC828DRAFT_387191 [Blastocladiella britannica]|nr:hypothetical protein BC828DRAFT_387191 [Blastocladiella britannica]